MISAIKILFLILLLDPRIVFDHNPNSVANREFKFKNIASPSKDDAAANAKLTLIDGDLDQGAARAPARARSPAHPDRELQPAVRVRDPQGDDLRPNARR